MNNNRFDLILKTAFLKYLETGERSNEKLKIIHGFIKTTIEKLLPNNYNVYSLSDSKSSEEKVISGIYMDKNIDISVFKYAKGNEVPQFGIAVKFVMSNYSQNSNNYFENMLGETANIRGAKIPYYQIFIIDSEIPYFKKGGIIKKWEKLTNHNLIKYQKMSELDIDQHLSIPNKTLIYVCKKTFYKKVNIQNLKHRSDFPLFFGLNDFEYIADVNINEKFGNNVLLNDFDKFIAEMIDNIKYNNQ